MQIQKIISGIVAIFCYVNLFLSCNDNDRKKIVLKFHSSNVNKNFVVDIENNSAQNLFFVCPTFYLQRKGCEDVTYLTALSTSPYSFCTGDTVYPDNLSYRFFAADTKQIVHSKSYSTLMGYIDSNWAKLTELHCKTDQLDQKILFIKSQEKLKYNYHQTMRLPKGEYQVIVSETKYYNNRIATQYSRFLKALKQVDRVDIYDFWEFGLHNSQNVIGQFRTD